VRSIVDLVVVVVVVVVVIVKARRFDKESLGDWTSERVTTFSLIQ
jgi:hypothetical protein